MKDKIKLAIVDDHLLFRHGMVQILSQIDDFEVVLEASNGKEFLEKLPNTAVDLILLDIQMPEMDGIEVTEYLRKKDEEEPKIIILSMHNEDQYILHLLEIGANGYLLKDTEPDEVELAIRKVNGQGIYFTDFVSRVMLRKATLKKLPRSGKFFNYKKDLSERESEVLTLICQGQTTVEIADKVCLSPRTVEGHRTRIMEKLSVKNTASLVAFAVKNQLIIV
ncbi:response regulator transcription factor [Arcticibacterium luteifluviistationis]|uniref:DNA-binding response regulator n=1 Tax=Arcticibacterium luteifluviistationis TaxID=1784714 RepID=A0A2Z4GFD4_9BACT|nr:response regulator transcription factor [Arcticibacterium luteifluviistationis]AWW00093.1 DNA-binding response regulator [Arcticibacterium luteifluviistationis]